MKKKISNSATIDGPVTKEIQLYLQLSTKE